MLRVLPILILFGIMGLAESDDSVNEELKTASPLSFYKPSYFLVYQGPVKFQFSIKYRLLIPENSDITTGMYLAYSQKSLWDLWNFEDSSPFIETNYNPEIFYLIDWRKEDRFFDFLQFGLEHESNGLGGTLVKYSRSWDRIYGSTSSILLHGILIFTTKGWIAFNTDKNSDIGKYLGNFEILLETNLLKDFFESRLDFRIRRGWGHPWKYYGFELGYTLGPFIIQRGKSKLPLVIYVQYWDGYGETLMNYKIKTTRLRMGLRFDL